MQQKKKKTNKFKTRTEIGKQGEGKMVKDIDLLVKRNYRIKKRFLIQNRTRII